MRKLLTLAVLGALMAPVSAMAAGYGMAGCGVGSLVFSKNDMVSQILASTTNEYFSQPISITIGVSNCKKDAAMKSELEQKVFADVNMNHLAQNMAAGKGEFLSAFATLLGCQESAQPALFELTHDRYETLFPRPNTNAEEMLSTLKGEMKAHPSLSQSCTKI